MPNTNIGAGFRAFYGWELIPDMFNRIEFRCVWQQAKQARITHIGRCLERGTMMPASAIQDHADAMLRMSGRDHVDLIIRQDFS